MADEVKSETAVEEKAADKQPKKEMGKSNPLRNYFLTAGDRFKRELITFPDGAGNELQVEIREPNSRQRGLIFKAATKIKRNKEPEIDHAELQVWAVIFCAMDPETGENLFDEAHHDILLDLPASVFDVLAKPALLMIGDAPEDAAGNS